MNRRYLPMLCFLAPAWVTAQSIPPLAPPAAAGQPVNNWVRIKAPGPDELWYDREKLVVSGADITFWRRVDFATPQAFKSFQVSTALFREQINCDEHTMRVHAHVFRAADGTIVEQANHAAPEAAPVIPDTVGDALWRALCPIVAGRRAADDRLKTMQERLDNRRRELDRMRVDVEELEASVTRLRTESRDPAPDAARDPVREPAREPPRQPGRQGL
ncbi:MAG: surface-adhesin E family protein [bacterium]|nr:hypothetical protein [Betaproteobacteria bacterium]